MRRILLIMAIIVGSLDVSGAGAQTSQKPTFLQVNGFYVAYTDPVVPFVSTAGQFMVSLRAISEVLGARLVEDAPNDVMAIEYRGRKVVFPRLHRPLPPMRQPEYFPRSGPSTMLVPLRRLIKGLHLISTWDAAHRTLSLWGRSLLKNPAVEQFTDYVGQREGTSWQYASLHLVPTEFALKAFPENGRLSLEVVCTFRNTSSRTFPAGRRKVDALIVPHDGKWMTMDVLHQSPDIHDPLSPAVGPGRTYQIKETIQGAAAGNVGYVLVWVRVGSR